MQTECKVRIYGLVSRVDGRKRVAVPPGEYTMSELSVNRYLLSREGGPDFELTLTEVTTYLRGEMKIIEGQWP